jgi:hypothetical protein
MVRQRVERNVMTVSEYEERFRFSAPSLHQTFVAMQGTSRGGGGGRVSGLV